ncbi:MAG TPA: hypothetical protein VK402_13260 [Blastococcus sp.]|nr:hypothetical protein [Blastococcus sp.]
MSDRAPSPVAPGRGGCSLTALVVLLAVAVALVGILFGIVRTHGSDPGRAAPATRPHRTAPGPAYRTGAQHRIEDAHTGSLSATAILRALNEGVGWVGRVPGVIHVERADLNAALPSDTDTELLTRRSPAGPGIGRRRPRSSSGPADT